MPGAPSTNGEAPSKIRIGQCLPATLGKAGEEQQHRCQGLTGAGFGVPKLNSTLGGTSEPSFAVKYGFSLYPNMPAKRTVGNRLTVTLYRSTASLNRLRSVVMRLSVPSS